MSSPASEEVHQPTLRFDDARHTPDKAVQQRNSYPALMHFAVLSGFLLPFALVPYLAARRRANWLMRRVEVLEAQSTAVEQDLQRLQSKLTAQRNEYKQLRAWMHEVLEEEDSLRARLELQEARQDASQEAVRDDLRKLIANSQHMRTQGTALRDLSTSLADVAAFMHEMELGMGMQSYKNDGRGIERLRKLALRMENLQRQELTDADGRPHV